MHGYLALFLLYAHIALAQYPLPIPFNGPAAANPPNSLDYQDASIIRRVSDGTYFRFTKSNDTGLGLSVATAPTFQGPWEYSYAAISGSLKDPIVLNRTDVNLWAPEVHYISNTYYLYYGFERPTSGNVSFDIAVATSPNLTEHSWTDHGSVNVPEPAKFPKVGPPYVRLGVNLLSNASDPSGIDSNYRHLAFGSYNMGLFGTFLNPDLLTANLSDDVTEMVADQYNPGDAELQGNKTEGSYQLHYGDYIYIFYSIGSCCASPEGAGPQTVYRVQMCRGLYSDGPTGPFLDRDGINCVTGSVNRTGTTLIASHGVNDTQAYQVFAPGSIGILNDVVEGLVVYYQYKNLTDNDQSLRFGFNYLGFDNDDWPVLLASQPTNTTNTSSTGASTASSTASSKTTSAVNFTPNIWTAFMMLIWSLVL